MKRRYFFRNVAAGRSLQLTATMLFNSCSNNTVDNTYNPGGGVTVDLNNLVYAVLSVVGGFAYNGVSNSYTVLND